MLLCAVCTSTIHCFCSLPTSFVSLP